ncbi:hypothetical protein HOY80DRAFT_992246 [Tuber brumale]|nr:hypothetical protein HOY80DRAFT_992246 [Tuber brumale]
MLRLFTRKQGVYLTSCQITRPRLYRSFVTDDSNGLLADEVEEDNTDKGHEFDRQRSYLHDAHSWHYVEKVDNQILSDTKDLDCSKVEVSKALSEMKWALEKGFGETGAKIDQTLIAIEKNHTEIQKNEIEIEKLHNLMRPFIWQVDLLSTGALMVCIIFNFYNYSI